MSFARVRALVVVGVLALAAAVIVVVAVVRDDQGGNAQGQECPAGAPVADVSLPREASDVTIRVLNGSGRPGAAADITAEFKNRRFSVQKPGESRTTYKGVAELRYGPDAVGRAQLLRAYFLDAAKTSYDAKRKGPVVDVVIGNQFRQLGTSTEVYQSLAQIGGPSVPPGTCVKKA
jgi:hypothetical protein